MTRSKPFESLLEAQGWMNSAEHAGGAIVWERYSSFSKKKLIADSLQ
jgi:hypothetical protein